MSAQTEPVPEASHKRAREGVQSSLQAMTHSRLGLPATCYCCECDVPG